MWNAIQCAVQGRGHIKAETPCQDKTYYLNSNGVDVIALADGAGSAKLSHYGAEIVTERVSNLLTKQFDIYFNEDDGVAIKRIIIGILQEELQKLACDLQCDIKDLASTLLVVAVHNGKYLILHIGDGVIGYIKNKELKIASHPENGEFANTTIFVTSQDVLSSMKLIKGNLNGITGFVLMSDGTETSLYNKREKRLAPVLKNLMDLSQVMDKSCLEFEIHKSFEEVIRGSTVDDCSLIMLVEEDYAFKGYSHLSLEKKRIFLGLHNGMKKKYLRRYNELLEYAVEPKSADQISKKIYLKKKYCRKYIRLLQEKNMLIQTKNGFKTSVIMSKE